MAELRFRVGAIFPADNPTARYVMAVSLVLGDIRTAARHAARADTAEHERLYFGRLLDLHVREGLALAVVEHRDREDVRRFVSILPDEAQEARGQLERTVTEAFGPYAGLQATGPDTFRCSRAIGESGGLRAAMEELAELESSYRLVGEEKRASYADLVVAAMSVPGEEVTPDIAALVSRLQETTAPVFEQLLTYLEHVEAAWLRPWRG